MYQETNLYCQYSKKIFLFLCYLSYLFLNFKMQYTFLQAIYGNFILFELKLFILEANSILLGLNECIYCSYGISLRKVSFIYFLTQSLCLLSTESWGEIIVSLYQQGLKKSNRWMEISIKKELITFQNIQMRDQVLCYLF